jgi:hypothetical protein
MTAAQLEALKAIPFQPGTALPAIHCVYGLQEEQREYASTDREKGGE